MLRTFQKEKLLNLIDLLGQLHTVFREWADGSGAQCDPADAEGTVADCQAAAIAIGTTIEERVPEPGDAVSILENYCEKLYAFSQGEKTGQAIDELDALLGDAKDRIEEFGVGYQVVFMPYKAQMWDSLESIWRAAKADPRCECLLVPIPYYEYEEVGNIQRGTLCCDRDLFDEEFDALDYRGYHIEQEKPDAVYVHNPFDEYNRVTGVLPEYYSRNLKKHTKLLVYSPYYVNGGQVTAHYIDLPSNDSFDYIIAQSEFSKTFYEGRRCYGKVLPFGSPKIDNVIRMSKDKPPLPADWEPILAGKKSLMLNTSINCFLRQGETYLAKLKNMFEWFKGRDDVALIWRPHPLLESTIKSMRGNMLERYRELVDFFEREKIGVLDRTPDVTATVTISDGYIGEQASSVTNLFAAALKPLFILNNTIYEDVPEENRAAFGFRDMVKVRGKWYFTAMGGMYAMNGDWSNIHLEKEYDWSYFYCNPYAGNMEVLGDEIFLSPNIASTAMSYNVVTKKWKKHFSHPQGHRLSCHRILRHKDTLIYLPVSDRLLTFYDTKKPAVEIREDCVLALMKGENSDGKISVSAGCVFRDDLYLVAEYANRVLRMDMQNKTYKVTEVGEKEYGYTSIIADADGIWLAEAKTGKIIHCGLDFSIKKICEMPEGWSCWTAANGICRAFGRLVDMGDWIVAVPVLSNCAVRIGKKSGECTLLAPEFFDGIDRVRNGYDPKSGVPVERQSKKMDATHIMLKIPNFDERIAIVDVTDGTYEVVYPHVDGETFERWTRDDGFGKEFFAGLFARRESALFTLGGFVDDLANDRLGPAMERQRSEISNITCNFDGTCGEHVHEFIMGKLEENN
ncbi:MAG: CDP-glycerol glycerophosphotransferase family protein [Clostridiales bacterium]|nr:CDP-glycerol glycerophosphotransferase family protein [Clostridiales bacterium]